MCRVRKVPPGTAVFETVSTEEYEGVIQTPMYHISPLVLSSGVLSYRINGAWARLLFSENDFKVNAKMNYGIPSSRGWGEERLYRRFA